MLTREQIATLRRPFRPEQIKNKVQTNPKNEKDEGGKKVGWGTMVFYLDSRDVAERLDLAVEGDWADEYSLFGKELECTLTVCGVSRRDVGEGGKSKELYSDAFKRAAVKFGVGAFLYRLPSVLCKMEKNKIGQWEPTSKALASLQRMKELAQGREVWPKKFDDVFLKSDFQASEDFSEPEKEEEETIALVPDDSIPQALREMGKANKAEIQRQLDEKGQNTEPVIVNTPVPVEQDTLLPEGEPESPEHNGSRTESSERRSEELKKLSPSPVPPVPASIEPSEFMPLVQSAKKALGIPAEQKPVKASQGDEPITQEERRKLMAVLSSFDVKKKEAVMSCLSFLLKRPLESSNEISTAEARSLINGLSLTDVEAWRDIEREEE